MNASHQLKASIGSTSADSLPDTLPADLSHPGGLQAQVNDFSLDPYAGHATYNGLDIYTPQQAADNLNRYGVDFTHGNYGVADDGVLTYGFWTPEQFYNSYFFDLRYEDGSAFNDDAYYAETYGTFEAFNAAQQVAAANALGLWDDLINVKFVQAQPGQTGDIMFGSALMSTAAGAHTFFPQAEALDQAYGSTTYGQTSGDVMINWFYNSPTGDDGGTVIDRPADTSFADFSLGSYGNFAITHELGHSLGLAHAGQYNASDGPATYDGSAYFAQDTQQYSIMSYFDGAYTGQNALRWNNSTGGTWMMAQTPAVHDILAVQNVYGADYTTRSGNTVYGFNSTADRDVFDFTKNDTPIVTIWDGGGIDTIDVSGFNSNQVIDLHEGAFSSVGYKMNDELHAKLVAAGWTTAKFDNLYASWGLGPDGRPSDNLAIAYNAKIENAVGGSGNDTIMGNALNNVLTGNAGDDVLSGYAGADTLNGGAGFDTASWSDSAVGVTVTVGNNFNGTASDGDKFFSVEKIEGSNLGDQLNGSSGNDTLSGIGGNDIIIGANGNDTLNGGAGVDRLDGGNGDDFLVGGSGNDTLLGGAGIDSLAGGTGTDTLTGGNGADLFVFANDGSTDTITDFQHGADKIDLSGVAGATSAYVTYDAAHHVVNIDTDHNGVADMFISVLGSSVGSGDYIFHA